MARRNLLGLLSILLTIGLSGCGESNSSGSTTATEAAQNSAAAVGAAFSSSSSSSMSPNSQAMHFLMSLMVREAVAQANIDTCGTLGSGPSNVTLSGQCASGTYGASSDSVTVDANTSCCLTSSGASNSNSSDLLLASFDVSAATVTCGSDTFTMIGSGVFRERNDITCHPQIYGAFTVTAGGDSTTVNCTICLDGNENVSSAECTDASGAAVSVADVSCSINAGESSDGSSGSACAISACGGDFQCQQVAEDRLTAGTPVCSGTSVSCMTCVDGCCEVSGS